MQVDSEVQLCHSVAHKVCIGVESRDILFILLYSIEVIMTELATLRFSIGGSQRYELNGLAEFMFYVIISF